MKRLPVSVSYVSFQVNFMTFGGVFAEVWNHLRGLFAFLHLTLSIVF